MTHATETRIEKLERLIKINLKNANMMQLNGFYDLEKMYRDQAAELKEELDELMRRI